MNAKRNEQTTEVTGTEVKVRAPLPQKSRYMTIATFPEVNSTEYWEFRRAMNGETHQAFTIREAIKELKTSDRDKIISYLLDKWVIPTFETSDPKRQIRQYLSQLTDKGWSRVLSAIQKGIEGKR